MNEMGLDTRTLEILYEQVRSYEDKQWIGFLISRKEEHIRACREGRYQEGLIIHTPEEFFAKWGARLRELLDQESMVEDRENP